MVLRFHNATSRRVEFEVLLLTRVGIVSYVVLRYVANRISFINSHNKKGVPMFYVAWNYLGVPTLVIVLRKILSSARVINHYTGWSANSHKVLNVKFFVKNQTRNHIDKMLWKAIAFKLLSIAIGQ